MEQLIILAVLVLLGYLFGGLAERRHYRSIQKREKKLLWQPAVTGSCPVGDPGLITGAFLVHGHVVISIDYFKRILASLRNLFGGAVTAYEPLLDRARREAVLRMKEACPQADQIINVRLETSSVHKGGKGIGSVEILAYGTALTINRLSASREIG